MCVLLGTSDVPIQKVLQWMIPKTLYPDYTARFTIEETEWDIRETTTTRHYGLVVLFINTLHFAGGGIRFDQALDLIRHVKLQERAIVLTLTTHRPRGFSSAAEQAGADAILDMPFTIESMSRAILCPLEARA